MTRSEVTRQMRLKVACSAPGHRAGPPSVRAGKRVVRLVTLAGGGHIAEFCFQESSGLPTLNPFWVPPWKTIEPYRYREKLHAARYGPPVTGKLICGLVGHNLCLDYFGPPSDEEAKQGLSLHGEAPSAKWQKSGGRQPQSPLRCNYRFGCPSPAFASVVIAKSAAASPLPTSARR